MFYIYNYISLVSLVSIFNFIFLLRRIYISGRVFTSALLRMTDITTIQTTITLPEFVLGNGAVMCSGCS